MDVYDRLSHLENAIQRLFEVLAVWGGLSGQSVAEALHWALRHIDHEDASCGCDKCRWKALLP